MTASELLLDTSKSSTLIPRDYRTTQTHIFPPIHRFGPDAQHSTHLATHTARNIVLVYVDVRGFARRALITKTGKEFVKARFGSKKYQTGNAASNPPSGAATPAVAATPNRLASPGSSYKA